MAPQGSFGATDVWSAKETWLDRFYERCGFPIAPGWTDVDIGAGIGEFILLASQRLLWTLHFQISRQRVLAVGQPMRANPHRHAHAV